jgi:hypothetical protein
MLCEHKEAVRMGGHWKIAGYDGAKTVFEQSIPEGSLSEPEMETLLQRLAARHLNDGEVVAASLRKNSAGYRTDLEIRKNQGGRYCLMTSGSGAHYTAVIEEVG